MHSGIKFLRRSGKILQNGDEIIVFCEKSRTFQINASYILEVKFDLKKYLR